jgi:hypothetical protein
LIYTSDLIDQLSHYTYSFSFLYRPLVWICCSEIYSSRLRGFSVSFATSFNWGFNAVIAKITPIMMEKIGAGTYMFFGSCAILMGVFVYFFVPETKGRSLEDIDKVIILNNIIMLLRFSHILL